MTWDATLFSRIVYGARISLFAGVSTVVLAMIIGVVLGLLAGYYGGWIDTIITRMSTCSGPFRTSSSPSIWWRSLGRGLTNVIIAVMLAYIDDFSRASQARDGLFDPRAAVCAGVTRQGGGRDARIILRHILPNSAGAHHRAGYGGRPVGDLAGGDAVVSGLGREADYADVGLILSDATFFSRLVAGALPGMAITVTVLSINFLGDALRISSTCESTIDVSRVRRHESNDR